MNKKSALEQALLEGEEILKAAKENAKEILASQLQPEIEKMVNESFLGEDSEDNEDEKVVDDLDTNDDVIEDEPEADDEDGLGDDSEEDKVSIDLDPIDSLTDVSDDTAEEGGEEDELFNSDEPELDMTNASDEELIQVFKKLQGTDEIEVIKDTNNDLVVKNSGNEYLVKLDEADDLDVYGDEKVVSENEEDSAALDNEYKEFSDNHAEDHLSSDYDDEDEIMYEIEMDGDDVENEIEPITEGPRTLDVGHKKQRKPVGFYNYAQNRITKGSLNESDSKKMLSEAVELKAKNESLIKENAELVKDATDYKDALRTLRESMNQLALFNNNLAHVNRLFCEHSTTKEEKIELVKRFDSVTTINESKALYKTIVGELASKTVIKESVEKKITGSIQGTGEMLTESVQIDPKMARIQQLMKYQLKK